MDAATRGYWREEFSLIALLFAFFAAIIVFSFRHPFDARLFPIVIGGAGLAFTLVILVEQLRRRRADAPVIKAGDPSTTADRPRFATALLSPPVFALLFWLFGFVVASLAAMLLMPVLMGYADRRRLLIVAVVTVAVLAVVFPSLLNVGLPHGLVGDWLIDKLALRAT